MLKARIRYVFDNIMSKGTTSAIIILVVASFFIILFLTIVVALFGIRPEGSESHGFIEGFWMSLMRTLDPGTMGDDEGWGFRIMMLIVTSYGIVMLSTFIGLISNGILTKLVELRKGRSKVLEEGHILILGWSSKIETIVSELVIANENQDKPVIVILADKDKVEMEDELHEKIKNTKNTKIICRSGNPIDINDLEIANPYDTKSIIILDNNNENSDAEIIKVILAITTRRNGRAKPYHITAEIQDERNMEVANMVGKDEVELVMSDEFISRIMVQTSRQSGLSVVYTDLLDFEGDEIYFTTERSLFGKTFKEAMFAYDTSSIIGLQLSEDSILLNPPGDTVIPEGAQVIAISEDDDTVVVSGKQYKVQNEAINEEHVPGPRHEKILILGWNSRAKIIIRELANYCRPGSTIKIVSEIKNKEAAIEKLNLKFPEIKIVYENDDTTDKEVLESMELNDFDHLLLLSYQDKYNVQQADAKTLITLLHLRNIAEKWGMALNIVSEMLDVKNRELAKVTNADDFIISDNIISLLMSQVSENKYLMRVFEKLFTAEGSEVYLKPIVNYVHTDKPLDFYTVLESAVRRGEIGIGYRKMEFHRNEEENYGIVLNPTKSQKISFSPEDFVIVLAED